jgi:hypothetical protein
MALFEHFIVTRFNLPLFKAKVDGKVVGNLDETWLAGRFDLFERYCLPSVKGQTCQDFRWIVLFDAATPQKFKDRFKSYCDGYNRLIPCYIDCSLIPDSDEEFSRLCEDYDIIVDKAYPGRPLDCDAEGEKPLRRIVPPIVKQLIDSCLDDNPQWILTTRLDSDDSLHKDFIATVRRRFASAPEHKVIDLVNTYKYIEGDGVVFPYPLINGHYITLAEPYEGIFQSVLFWNHLFVGLFLPVDHVYDRPLQIEVIHGGNVVNDFSHHTAAGLIKGLFGFKPRDFGLKGLKVNRSRIVIMLLSLLKKDIKKRFS